MLGSMRNPCFTTPKRPSARNLRIGSRKSYFPVMRLIYSSRNLTTAATISYDSRSFKPTSRGEDFEHLRPNTQKPENKRLKPFSALYERQDILRAFSDRSIPGAQSSSSLRSHLTSAQQRYSLHSNRHLHHKMQGSSRPVVPKRGVMELSTCTPKWTNFDPATQILGLASFREAQFFSPTPDPAATTD
jgi:hypothetical protein